MPRNRFLILTVFSLIAIVGACSDTPSAPDRLGLTGRAGVQSTGYTITDLAPTAGSYSSGMAINASGAVVGFISTSTGRQAVMWSKGRTTYLGVLPGNV